MEQFAVIPTQEWGFTQHIYTAAQVGWAEWLDDSSHTRGLVIQSPVVIRCQKSLGWRNTASLFLAATALAVVVF